MNMIDDLFDDDDILDVDGIEIDNLLDDDTLLSEGHSFNEETDDSLYSQGDGTYESSFLGSKYTDAEIDRMRSDISSAEYEMKCREHDVNEWESKVSLNNTKEKIANGDYAAAVSRLNEAKSRYNAAKVAFDHAKSRLNNAL